MFTPSQQKTPFCFLQYAVLYNYYVKVVMLEELNRQATIDTSMADESSASRVHLIVDLCEAKIFPVNILSINAAVKVMLRHSKMGWVLVLANQNRLLRTLALMVPQ